MAEPFQQRLISGSGGGGGKGGGARGRAPVEAPNTLRSRATARVIDLIGEGENVGLLDGARSIKFDGTRLQNEDGSYNFAGVTWAEKTGTPNQDYLPGFAAVEAETIVGVDLTNDYVRIQPNTHVTHASPAVYTIGNALVTDATIEVIFPRGLSAPAPQPNRGYGRHYEQAYGQYYQNKIATSVTVAIDLQSNGGGYVQLGTDTITELSTAAITRSYGFSLIGSPPWNIRVRRITPDMPATVIDEMRVQALSYSSIPPAVRTISNLDATSARVTMRLPSGLFEQSTSTGDVNPSSVALAIDVRPSGGNWRGVLGDTIAGKTTTPYEISYRFNLTQFGAGPWDIRVRRLTPSNQGINITNSLSWASFTTIIDHKIRYSDSHVIGVAVDAEAFGGRVPTRSYHIRGRIIQVPTNYDPETRIYTGIWDGTFKLAWSDNPAWCFYDMVMHRRYGLGEFVQEAGLKWDLHIIGQYCDELVPDGKGGYEPRYTFNGGFQAADEANRVIQAMASVFRGMAWWGSGGIAASADMPSDPVKLVSPANVINGEIKIAGTALKARHTVVMVQWNDPQDSYRLNIEMIEDLDAIDRFGWRPVEVAAVGCTSQGQAHRVGRWILDSEQSETQAITYAASWDHADVRPGQIISVADPAFSGVRRAGRIKESTANLDGYYNTIVIDAPVTLDAGMNYSIHYMQEDGTIHTSPLSNAPATTDTLMLLEPLNVEPLANAMWVLSGDDVAPRPFRVLAVRETDKHLFEISGLFHDATKYARVEENIRIEPPVFSTIPTGPIKPPINLRATEYLFLAGGTSARSAVTLSWTAPEDARVQYYETQFRPIGGNWQGNQVTQSHSIDLLDFGSGAFDFRVRAMDGGLRPSAWAELLNVSISGLLLPADDVEGFRISILGDVATLTWKPARNLNLSHYVLRFSPDTSAEWNAMVLLLDDIATTSVQVPAMIGVYAIKAETVQGVRSINESLILNEVAGHNQMNAVESSIQQPFFAGTRLGVTVNPDYDGLQLDVAGDFFAPDDFFSYTDFFLQDVGFEPEGIYYFDNIIDLGEVFTSRLTAYIEAFGVNFSADFFGEADFFNPPDIFKVPADTWGARLQFLATSDDPLLDPNFDPDNFDTAPWQDFMVSDYTARAYAFRLILTADEFGISPVVPRLEVTADMPDRVISQEDLAVGTSGRRIDFLPPLRALTGVSISAQGLATGDYYLITNKDNYGFDIIFKNAANAAIARTFDYVAAGYGRMQ